MCIEFVHAESGEECIPPQQWGETPKPGDVISWGSGDFQVVDGPRKFARHDQPIVRWVLKIPVKPIES
jgi:hypothetical protein